jgi:carbamoyl-phosphate synthase large subunit
MGRCVMINLLVTTAGGSGIYSAIEAVKSSKYKDRINLILVDSNELAGALYEVKKSYVLPMVSDDKYFCVLQEIIKKENVTHMISLLDEELNFLSDKVEILDKMGVKTLIPNSQSLINSWDKSKTYEICKKFMPKTYILDGNIDIKLIWDEFKGRLLLKPATSRGGRGIIIPEDIEELNFFANRFIKQKKVYLVQKLIEGKEYNITSLHSKKGEVIYAVSRWKFEKRVIKSGSKASVIVNSPSTVNFALKILKKMNLEYGFNNIEVIENDEGIFLLEVNAGRIAAQDMNIVKAGINYVDLFIDVVDNNSVVKPSIKYGVCNIKTSRDIWVDMQDIERKVLEYEKNINNCGSS